MATQITHWIDNKLHDDASDRHGDVFNPATGEIQARVAFASPAVVDVAVESAWRASQTWRHASIAKRTKIMFAFRELVANHAGELAKLLTLEHGKVTADAMGEVQRGLEVIEFACGIADLSKGEFSENVSTEVDTYSIRQPLGVVAGITPFNFPAMVPMWMFPVAIACGNAFILKPSERDPSASILCAQLLAEAGLPPGVFNVVHGDKVAVDRLLEHPKIAAVSFVGSTPIARYIYETGTAHGKRVQALGGAKNHMLVLPDADMELAADAAVSAGYGSAGERCMAISMLVAVGAAADRTRAAAPGADREARGRRWPRAELRDGPADQQSAPRQGPRLRRQWRRRGRDARQRRPRHRGRGPAERLLPRALPVRSRAAGHGDLQGRDLRAGAVDDARRDLRRGDRAGQLQPIRQWRGDLHQRWRRGPQVPARGTRRDDRNQRPDSGAGRLLLVRRLEGLPVWRPPHLWSRGRPVLYAHEGRDLAVAGSARTVASISDSSQNR